MSIAKINGFAKSRNCPPTDQQLSFSLIASPNDPASEIVFTRKCATFFAQALFAMII